MRFSNYISYFIAAALISSCAVGPDYKRPDMTHFTPADWRWKTAEPKDTERKGDWWKIFNDPVLNDLETNAVAGNQNLRSAVARVDESRAAARMTRSQFLPGVVLDPSANRERVSGNEPIPFPPSPIFKLRPFYMNTFSVPFDLSYEIDLWGRVRRSFESVRAQAQAEAADYQNVVLTLTADVAVNYYLLRSLDSQIATLNGIIEAHGETVRILGERANAGGITEAPMEQAKTSLANAKGQLAGLNMQRAETFNALALLCGKSPTAFEISVKPLNASPPEIPPGLPSTVLERRPDIAAAERNMVSYNAQIGVARSAYFPVLRLTGQAGFLSGELDKLFSADSATWSLGPSVSIPVFTAGRTRAQVRQAESAYHQSVAEYRQAALTAFKEVEDSLVQINSWKEQSAAQAEAIASSQRAADITRARADNGILTTVEVLEANRAVLEQQQQLEQIIAEQFTAAIHLIKALGGSVVMPAENR